MTPEPEEVSAHGEPVEGGIELGLLPAVVVLDKVFVSRFQIKESHPARFRTSAVEAAESGLNAPQELPHPLVLAGKKHSRRVGRFPVLFVKREKYGFLMPHVLEKRLPIRRERFGGKGRIAIEERRLML